MPFKTLILILFAAVTAYRLFVNALNLRSRQNHVPANVQDIYDAETYERWRRYTYEKQRNQMAQTFASFAVQALLLWGNVYAAAFGGIGNVYLQALAVMALSLAVDVLCDVPFSYIDTMVIEQKYGFNRSTVKTFVADQIKGLLIMSAVFGALLCLLILIHTAMGDGMLVLFAAVLAVLVLAIGFLAPVLQRVSNTFTPLPEGALRDKLTALLTKYGYRVKAINVMDASKRTTKSNAQFAGFGKMKTIILYDTLLETMDEDEICAVFAHEMAHGLNRDTLKMMSVNLAMVVPMALLLWLTVRTPALFVPFGFAGVNYGLAMIVFMLAEFPFVSQAIMPLLCAVSRRAEYRADRQAVKDGYGAALAAALRKLAKEDFADLAPSKLLVMLEYSHPPIAERLAAIETQAVCK